MYFFSKVEVKAHRTDVLPYKNPSRQNARMNASTAMKIATGQERQL